MNRSCLAGLLNSNNLFSLMCIIFLQCHIYPVPPKKTLTKPPRSSKILKLLRLFHFFFLKGKQKVCSILFSGNFWNMIGIILKCILIMSLNKTLFLIKHTSINEIYRLCKFRVTRDPLILLVR